MSTQTYMILTCPKGLLSNPEITQFDLTSFLSQFQDYDEIVYDLTIDHRSLVKADPEVIAHVRSLWKLLPKDVQDAFSYPRMVEAGDTEYNRAIYRGMSERVA